MMRSESFTTGKQADQEQNDTDYEDDFCSPGSYFHFASLKGGAPLRAGLTVAFLTLY